MVNVCVSLESLKTIWDEKKICMLILRYGELY